MRGLNLTPLTGDGKRTQNTITSIKSGFLKGTAAKEALAQARYDDHMEKTKLNDRLDDL